MNTSTILAIAVIALIVYLYYDEIMEYITPAPSVESVGKGEEEKPADKYVVKKEDLGNPNMNGDHSSELPWQEAIKLSVLDPSVRENHNRFAADVARYSSGAAFTSVNDSLMDWASANWVGFSRPRYVPRRKGLLQAISQDERIYYQNRPISW